MSARPRQRRVHGFTATVAAKRPPPLGVTTLTAPEVGAPAVTYHNGPLIRNVETTAVFLGSKWATPPLSSVPAQVEAFLAMYAESSGVTSLSAYNRPQILIGSGTNKPHVLLTSAVIGATIDDATVQRILSTAVAAGALPPTNPNTLYLAFLPDGTMVTAPGVGKSCVNHCGYHFDMSGTPYAVLPYPSCSGCLPGAPTPSLSVFQSLTSTTSHEICEAITNPLGTGWYRDSDNSEIGDLCAWETTILAGFTVQKMWLPTGGCS